MRDRLFVIRPGFVDPARGEGRFFCPYCAQVPLLVLGDERDGDAARAAGVPIGTFEGRRFVEKTADILRYLAATRQVPQPHF